MHTLLLCIIIIPWVFCALLFNKNNTKKYSYNVGAYMSCYIKNNLLINYIILHLCSLFAIPYGFFNGLSSNIINKCTKNIQYDNNDDVDNVLHDENDEHNDETNNVLHDDNDETKNALHENGEHDDTNNVLHDDERANDICTNDLFDKNKTLENILSTISHINANEAETNELTQKMETICTKFIEIAKNNHLHVAIQNTNTLKKNGRHIVPRTSEKY